MKNKKVIRTYKILPKQKEFLNSECKETLMSGAWGSSKSYALCLSILKESTVKDAQILLCRKNYTALRKSTLQTLLYGDNPVLPPNSYKYNKVAQTITMNGSGAIIYLLGVEDIMKVRSMNLSFIAVDEVSELNEWEWVELIGRLRCRVGSRRIVGATNPASPSHWLYERFFKNITKSKSRKVIKSCSLDNPFLPRDYIDTLSEMPEHLYNKFVLGEWIALENVIYSQFRREEHIKERTEGEFISYMLGVDFGFTNPCAVTLLGVDGDDNIHLISEEKQSKLLISGIMQLVEKYRVYEPTVIIDPSAPALIAQFDEDGWDVKKADNSIDSGIARFQDYLHKHKFTISPKCTEFLKEIENYIYDDNGKPIQKEDHLLDSVRYCLNDLVADVLKYKPPVILSDYNDDEDYNEQMGFNY